MTCFIMASDEVAVKHMYSFICLVTHSPAGTVYGLLQGLERQIDNQVCHGHNIGGRGDRGQDALSRVVTGNVGQIGRIQDR